MLSGKSQGARRTGVLLAVCVCGFLGLASAASALPIINGSFESGPAVGSWTTISSGSTALTGWEVIGGGVDYMGSLWVASDGNRSLDLNASSAGGVQQAVSTVSGQSYDVLFDLSRNIWGGGAGVYSVRVSAGATSQIFTFNGSPTAADMQWEENHFAFTAASSNTLLIFESLDAGNSGPALDNVRVAEVIPVPEPSTALLTGLILTGLGVARRRRARA